MYYICETAAFKSNTPNSNLVITDFHLESALIKKNIGAMLTILSFVWGI